MPLLFVQQDITQMAVDAIVNAANPQLQMGSGVCGAIFRAAGPQKLQAACDQKAPIRTGEAALTPGFALPARYVIHAAGPVYNPRHPEESERLLRSAYTSALRLAAENHCASVAFPLISGGIFGYPKDQALSVAVSAIQSFLETQELDVYLAFPDKRAFVVEKDLLAELDQYLTRRGDESVAEAAICAQKISLPPKSYCENVKLAPQDLDDLLGHLDEPFNVTLLRLIDAKGLTDAPVYHRANLDRRLFSKIRTGKGYSPTKRTILALAIALELNLDETDDLLARAGYALSPSQKFDVIVQYFILKGQYDIYAINEVLFHYDQPLLGGAA